jgi:serine/threonine protein kinase/Tfp pilus assembly protein PilF
MAPNGFEDDQTRSFTSLAAGTVVSHYEIVSKIGSGGMGEVYLALDTKLDRNVALKFLPSHLCQDEDCRKRFTREAQAAAGLDHPNVAAIHEVGEFHSRPFYAMQVVEGQSLKDVIAGKDLSIDRILEIAIQACEGLQAAHDKGIIHRDVKPSNILLDVHGRVRIIDFGLAAVRGSEQLTKTESTLGTIGYMSPEQVQGKEIDHRSDLFSLGVVLFEMVTLQNPFRRENEAASINAVLQYSPHPLNRYSTDASHQLQSVVSKALEKKQELRYQSASDLANDLRRLKGEVASRQTKKKYRSIAVLPFVDMSFEKDQEYFCDGLSEELINGLTQIENLKVAARTSAVQFRERNQSIVEIGRHLGVDTVLDGSIRTSARQLRITVQLVDVDDGFHIWSKKFDRTVDDVFAIQDEISLAVTENLRLTLTENEKGQLVKRHTENKEAYDWYLKGRYLWNNRHEGSLYSALDAFGKAIAIDPSFALPYLGMAEVYVVLGSWSLLPANEVFPKAKDAARKALELDERMGEAHATLGLTACAVDWSWSDADREFDLCFSLTPRYATGYSWYALYLASMGRHSDAKKAAEFSMELEPMSLICSSVMGLVYGAAREYEEACAQLLSTLERDHRFQPALLWLAWNYYGCGRFDDALELIRQLEALPGGKRYAGESAVALLARQGDLEQAGIELKELKRLRKTEYIANWRFALISWVLERRDDAFHYLEAACRERECLPLLRMNPVIGEVYNHPRFAELFKQYGLSL